MRSTLAIYITLFAVAAVATAQILYWKLVVARDPAVADEDPAGEGWLPGRSRLNTWRGRR